MMSKTLEITVSIKDESGKTVVSNQSKRTVPYIDEIEEQGFRAAFHELETAVLEARKEAGDRTVSDYLANLSQKNGI